MRVYWLLKFFLSLFILTFINLTSLTLKEVFADFIIDSGSTLTVTNNATLDSSGSIVLNGLMDVSGSPSGKIRLTANWNKPDSGVFVQGNSTVTFYNVMTSSLTGNTTFSTLVCEQTSKQINVQNTSTQGVTGVLTLTGTRNNEIKLRSSESGVKWFIRPTNSQTVNYIDVKDSDALINTIRGNYSLDSGNTNDLWEIGEIGVMIVGATTYNYGTLELAVSTVSASSFTVKSVGYDLIDYKINATTNTANTPWSLADSAGSNQLSLRVAFSSYTTVPTTSDFGAEDVLTYADQTSSASKFSIGESSGTTVPPNENRYLWYRLDTPNSSTNVVNQQEILITITATRSP